MKEKLSMDGWRDIFWFVQILNMKSLGNIFECSLIYELIQTKIN